MLSPLDRLGRARQSLDGLSVGDAFGESFVLYRRAAGERRPGAAPPWRWTDDTAMALAVVEALARDGDIVPDTLAAGFARRYTAEPWRGYGATAQGMLEAIADGVPWRQAARAPFGGQGSKGNGAAMRAAPIGAYFADDLARVVAAATASAQPTHAHRDGVAGAIAVAVAAAIATRVGGAPGPTDGAALLATVYDHTPTSLTRDGIDLARRLPPTTAVRDAAARLGNGSRVLCEDTVPLCVWLAARHLGDYHEALWQTVAALGDLDTNAAIVGGILAAGGAVIPPAWLAAREPLPS
jgi:ADP-ribosylglycohydrolase